MKHTAIIGFERATCSCGQMPGIWRKAGEEIGRFTLRADAAHREHVAAFGPGADLFDYRKMAEPVEEAQRGLFG